MKRVILLFIVLLGVVGTTVAASDFTVRPSVMVDYSVSPEYLMPGDTGTVTVTLENGAEDYVYQVPVDNGTETFELSAPIRHAGLQGNEHVNVTSNAYRNVGLLGPGDTINFKYSIRVPESTRDGTYFLDFNFVGGNDMYEVNWRIPVVVDSSGVKIISAETGEQGHVVMDIANTRPNTIHGVSVIPTSDSIQFEPKEYFIGTMESDEMFTVQMNLEDRVNGSEDVGFKVVYRNGETWHETNVKTLHLEGSTTPTAVKSSTQDLWIVGLLGVMLLAVVGFFVYMRRRRGDEI